MLFWLWFGFSVLNFIFCCIMMWNHTKTSIRPLNHVDFWATFILTILGPIGTLVLIIVMIITGFNSKK